MNHRPSLLLCALAVAGCNNHDGNSGSTGSSSTGSGSGPMTTGGASSGEVVTSEVTFGTGTSGHVPTTTTSSTGETTEEVSSGAVASTTGSTGETTGEPAGPAPDWGLVDVNPNSATHAQTLGPSSFAGSVSGWYFAHAT